MRYKKIIQKPYCCVAACLQMVLRRNNIPYKTQEEIGCELGLTVPLEYKDFYPNAIFDEKPESGYGTQVQKKEYSINNFFKKNNILLKEEYYFLENIEDTRKFIEKNKNNDIIVCLNVGVLYDNKSANWGHGLLIESMHDDKILLVDPSLKRNYEMVKIEKVIEAIKFHGKEKRAGFWLIKKV